MIRVHSIFNKAHRLDGAPFMTYNALRRLPGVDAYWYDAHTDPSYLPKADITVAIDWAEDALNMGDYQEAHPNVYWCSDSHISEASFRFRLEKARRCDRAFVSIWSDVERFAAEGVKVEWLPYAAEPLCYRPFPEIERKYDIGFMGFFLHHEERTRFLDAMVKRFPNHVIECDRYFEDAARIMASAKVNLNHCHVNATNMRVFECMAGGNALLTPRTKDLDMLGARGACVVYDSLEDAYERCQWLLDNPDNRNAIGWAARSWVMGGHTYVHRACRLLGIPYPENIQEIINTWPPTDEVTPLPVRRMA